jgi:hypothetical protein
VGADAPMPGRFARPWCLVHNKPAGPDCPDGAVRPRTTRRRLARELERVARGRSSRAYPRLVTSEPTPAVSTSATTDMLPSAVVSTTRPGSVVYARPEGDQVDIGYTVEPHAPTPRNDDFFEEDESIEKIRWQYEHGEPFVTAPAETEPEDAVESGCPDVLNIATRRGPDDRMIAP